MRRTLAIAALVALAFAGVVWAQSLTWDGAYESSPAATAPVHEGDDRIRELKRDARERIDVDHEFAFQGANTAQTGRHIEGTARSFFQDAEPAAMPQMDTAASTTRVEGITWYDSNDENACRVFDAGSAVFEACGLTGLNAIGGVLTLESGCVALDNPADCCTGAGTGPTCVASVGARDMLRFDALSHWTPADIRDARTTSTGTRSSPQAIAGAAPVAITLAPGNPTAVVPAVGTYDIFVYADIVAVTGTGGAEFGVRLREFDGAATTTVDSAIAVTDFVGRTVSIPLTWRRLAAAVSTTFTYSLEAAHDGGAAWTVCPDNTTYGAGAGFEADFLPTVCSLEVRMVPRNGMAD